ncbi:hypothetical protein CJ030_MR1G026809 [Morella rubra]|uniref:Uncharacterized protein n=1 Tax=Morella rubra TaxID=262757 RepID=A0A6A1WPP5_9ROSI|nr:hypothetical protein CJ030_MR1G026809 [Morella rubra]
MMVPQGADKPRVVPHRSINKTTLSKSMAQTRRVLSAARADDVMPAEGKRLRCDSSVQAESSPSTLAVSGPLLRDRNELPSPTTANLVGTQSSCASTSRIRHVQGSTRGIALLKARTGGKLTVHIPDGHTGGDDKASSMLSSHIGALVRQHVPFETSKWKEVPDEVKSYVMNRVLRRSAINKENRAKLKIVHTSGARSFQHARVLLVRKNRALQLQHESEGKSYTEVEIFAEVLGTKAGYVRGLGRSVRSIGSSSSVSSVDLSQRLEEARLEIEKMRARQMEYEVLLVKRSDMKQMMREHLQMMEEQQQKKDEELDDGRANNKKRRRESEDDAGAAKEPSGTTRTDDATNGGAYA